ncbi:MAG: ABC transporter ATP-binding protein [Chloroflexia bacterium]|nr:ABC transporter ATP-binding protein [Chloroflexia bacterium]
MVAIQFSRVSKHFVLEHERDRSFQELLVNLWRRLRQTREREDFWALRDASFTVRPGETLGIIGENGSGKSTTLKLISRILEPTTGRIVVNGRVSALLELGAGFHPDLTGRENIYLNAAVLGFSRREIRDKVDEIVQFAELDRFIDIPLKHYSSGMNMRLGFSVAIHVDPDILLTDEVLAVGDESFQRKCMDKIADLQQQGKTILFVSHSMDTIRNICSQVLWLHEGRVRAMGDVEQVVDAYLLLVHEQEAQKLAKRRAQIQVEQSIPPTEQAEIPAPSCQPQGTELDGQERWGSGEVRLLEVRFLDAAGEDCFLHKSGDPATIELSYEACVPTENPVFGIGLYRQDGLWVYGTNTDIERIAIRRVERRGGVRFQFPKLNLLEGQYWLSVAVHARDGTPYDYWQRCCEFSVYSQVSDKGVYRPDHHWELNLDQG